MQATVTRRTFAHSMLACGAAAATSRLAIAQLRPVAGRAVTRRVDVHHHFLPPDYVATMGAAAIGAPAPNGSTPDWSVARSLEMMDRQGISGAVLSISTPGVLLGDMAATRRLARASNLFAAQTVADHPTRFGMFASLPLPEVKASLAEIAYALDTLRAEGVVLLTNYRDRYLGDAAFMPVFDELNHRKATVYVHPTSCGCNHGVLPDNPTAMIEFPHDTTRTVSSLLSSGTFTRCPDIKFIFSHAGGTVPFLADRMARIFAIDRRLAARTPGGILPILKRQYYDTASTANPMSFGALINMVTPANVLLGTDYPFVAEAGVKGTIDGLRQVGLDSDAIAAIEGGNAARLFARFAA